MKPIIFALAVCSMVVTSSMLYAQESSLETYRILVTANAEEGDLCGPKGGCGDRLNAEQLADRIAEQLILMLYRFEKTGASLEHKYQQEKNSFLWGKPDDFKQICDAGQYDAVFSMNLDGADTSVGSRGKRDLWLKWFDCSSLETWSESIDVNYGDKGWDFRQQIYKYLDVVFPYFVDQ